MKVEIHIVILYVLQLYLFINMQHLCYHYSLQQLLNSSCRINVMSGSDSLFAVSTWVA